MIFENRSILDVWLGSEYTSEYTDQLKQRNSKRVLSTRIAVLKVLILYSRTTRIKK